MINIVCLKFGTLYGPEYVNKLLAGVKRNITVPYMFHCFTDNVEGIHPDVTCHPLPFDLPGVGWWHKLYLFSNNISIDGRIFYVDLDTLITGNIDEMVSHEEEFICLRDLFLADRPTYKDRFGFGKDAVGSGVLAYDAKQHTNIWETFIKDPKKAVQSLHPHGDQKWIQQHQKERLYFQDLFPKQCVSFKVHCRSGLPKDARLVCYHGKPSIPQSMTETTKVQGYTLPPVSWPHKYWNDEIT